jgi:NAD(P)-dependent dehydrogenase (short-subunit alcohol dehydrogenase family)
MQSARSGTAIEDKSMRTKQSAIIVGAGPRLSLAIARKFGKQLGEVALISRNGYRLSALVSELKDLGITAHSFVADAANLDDLSAAIRDAIGATSLLKALIYNAAAVQPNRPLGLDPSDFVKELTVDVVAPLAAAQTVAPVLEKNGGGSVLFTGGWFATAPSLDMAALSAGKAALRNLAATLAEDLKPKGIRTAVVTISNFLSDHGRFAPEEIAESYWQLHTSGVGERSFELTYT